MKAYIGLLGFVGGMIVMSGALAEPEFNRDPSKARVHTEDLDRFWQAWDLAEDNPEQRREIFQQEYLDRGSAGLKAFTELRIESVDRLIAAIDAYSRYYASLRPQTPRAQEVVGATRDAMFRLQTLLPDAVFPDVYIVIGAMNSGGTLHPDGLLIGFEMNARGPDSPTDELTAWHRSVIKNLDGMPALIIHELIHYQQAVLGRLDHSDLLGASIMEGAADFLAELITGVNGNAHIHEWALPREAELWAEFNHDMHRDEMGDWLYGGSNTEGRPADLGYFVGYRIVEAYYERAEDKAAAIRAIVEMSDPDEFLALSGYAETMARLLSREGEVPEY